MFIDSVLVPLAVLFTFGVAVWYISIGIVYVYRKIRTWLYKRK